MREILDSKEINGARANVYLFFSRIFREPPTQDLLDFLLSERGFDILKTLFPREEVLRDLGTLMEEVRRGGLSLEEFQLDFDSLMRVPGPWYVRPYESVYRHASSPGDGPKPTLMGEPAYQVSALYQKAGLEPCESTTNLPDELTVELEFMGRLCKQAERSLEANEQERAWKAIAMQREFLTEHLLSWAPLCLEKIISNAQTPLYKTLSRLLISFLEEEEDLFR
ncbi:MAG: molecular chaperone [Desulfatiglandales bacterium]